MAHFILTVTLMNKKILKKIKIKIIRKSKWHKMIINCIFKPFMFFKKKNIFFLFKK